MLLCAQCNTVLTCKLDTQNPDTFKYKTEIQIMDWKPNIRQLDSFGSLECWISRYLNPRRILKFNPITRFKHNLTNRITRCYTYRKQYFKYVNDNNGNLCKNLTLKSRITMYSGDLKSDHLKSKLFEGWISNGRALALVPTIWKLDHLESRHFYPDYKWFLTRWPPFWGISNG